MASGFRYIVVEGPIGVGKTSLAKKLAADLNAEVFLENAADNPFLADFYRNPKQYALSVQLHFLLQRVHQIEAFRETDLFRHTCVADFMMAKDQLFAALILTPDELKLYEQIFSHLTIDTPKPDLVIYLQAPVNALQQRIMQRGIDYEQLIRDDYLSRLSEAYNRFFFEYDDSAVLTVNTETLDLVNQEEDYRRLLDKISGIRSGRHYFNQSSLTF